MSLWPVPQITQGDVLNARVRTFAQDPIYRQSAKSWAYYRLKAYEPQYGMSLDSPYSEWDETALGPRPVCQPLGKIIVDSSAEFLMGEAPHFTIPTNIDLEKLLQKILDDNAFASKLLPEAKSAGNEGARWLKFAWTPQTPRCPVNIVFLSPWEVKAFRNPLNSDDIQMIQVTIKYADDSHGGLWKLYREEWTAQQLTVYQVLDTDENDDHMIIRQFVNGQWPIDHKEINRFGVIPFWQVYNRRYSGDTDGVGDIWDIYNLLNQYSHTLWLMHRSNQTDGDPVTALVNCTTAPDVMPAAGGVIRISGQDAAIQRLTPENNLRQWMADFAMTCERNTMDAVGGDRLNPDSITNKGNLTTTVKEFVFIRSGKTTQEKRCNWGKQGLEIFFERMLEGLSRIPEAVRMFPILGTVKPAQLDSFDVVTEWPPLFRLTADELAVFISNLALAINTGLLTRERAVQMYAGAVGITDVQTLLEELQAAMDRLDAMDQAAADQLSAQVDAISAQGKSDRVPSGRGDSNGGGGDS